MDSEGRLVIPKSVRIAAGLQPGVPIQIRCRDGVIEIEPAPLKVSVERCGRLTVAVSAVPVAPLTNAMVERARK